MGLINRKEEFKNEIERTRAYHNVFSSELGERVLWDIARNSYFDHHTLDELPHRMAAHEGMRNVVLRILSILERDPAKLEELSRSKGPEGDIET